MKRSVILSASITIPIIVMLTVVNIYQENETDPDHDRIYPGDREIRRIYGTEEERLALERAELLPLPEYLNMTRFESVEGSNDPSACEGSLCFFNLIDKVTIDAYIERFDRFFWSNETYNSSFHYTASSERKENLRIVYNNLSNELFIGKERIEIFGWRSYLNINGSTRIISWSPISRMETLPPPNLSMELDQAYMINQRMSYHQWWFEYSDYGSSVLQIVVMNSNLEPVLIHVSLLGHSFYE